MCANLWLLHLLQVRSGWKASSATMCGDPHQPARPIKLYNHHIEWFSTLCANSQSPSDHKASGFIFPLCMAVCNLRTSLITPPPPRSPPLTFHRDAISRKGEIIYNTSKVPVGESETSGWVVDGCSKAFQPVNESHLARKIGRLFLPSCSPSDSAAFIHTPLKCVFKTFIAPRTNKGREHQWKKTRSNQGQIYLYVFQSRLVSWIRFYSR